MFVSINDCELYVEDLGPRDGPPIIAHHGGPGVGDHQSAKGAYEGLADEYRLILFDARGSGRSELQGPYTHEQWAADVEALREHFGFESFVMAGGSYGGFIALEVAIRYPDRVDAIILRDTAPDHSFMEEAIHNALNSPTASIDPALLERVMEGRTTSDEDLRDCFAALLPLYDVRQDAERDQERLQGSFHHETHNYAFSVNIPRYDLTDELPQVEIPTLVTAGRHDWITPVTASEKIHALMPRSYLRVFEDSGHSPDLEETHAFQSLIRGFLAGVALGAVGQTPATHARALSRPGAERT